MAVEFITKKIKNGLIAVLKTVEATENGTKIQEVTDTTVKQFVAYPSVRVLPNDLDNSPETNRSDSRVAGFTLLVHIELENTPESESDAFDTMYDLQDAITQKLAEYDWTNSLNILSVNVTTGNWEVLEMQTGLNLVFRMDVAASYSHKIY